MDIVITVPINRCIANHCTVALYIVVLVVLVRRCARFLDSLTVYVYSIWPSKMICHKLWLPNCIRLEQQNIWRFMNFKATGISKAILEKERTLTNHTSS